MFLFTYVGTSRNGKEPRDFGQCVWPDRVCFVIVFIVWVVSRQLLALKVSSSTRKYPTALLPYLSYGFLLSPFPPLPPPVNRCNSNNTAAAKTAVAISRCFTMLALRRGRIAAQPDRLPRSSAICKVLCPSLCTCIRLSSQPSRCSFLFFLQFFSYLFSSSRPEAHFPTMELMGIDSLIDTWNQSGNASSSFSFPPSLKEQQ